MAKGTVLGVLGGLGPMATVYFYELVTRRTAAARDQDHIDMVISSKATTPDRTAFILGTSLEDPFTVMLSEAQRLQSWGADIIAIPCNTAHYFYERLAHAVQIPVLNMIEDTINTALARGAAKVGILATDGTIHTKTYQRVCEAKGLACAIPSDEAQKSIMSVIYNDIKSGNPPNMAHFAHAADELFDAGCEALILGCTELSLVKKHAKLDETYIDSMEVLADAAILACGKQLAFGNQF